MELIESPLFGRNVFDMRTFCVVTGASKGYGKCIVDHFCKLLAAGSAMVLIARSESLLLDVKNQLEAVRSEILVDIKATDLSKGDEDTFKGILLNSLKNIGKAVEDFDQAVIVHNAASMGDITKKMTEIGSSGNIRKYFDLNVTSVISLNHEFFKLFNRKTVKQVVVINVTSICAIQPFKTWSLYCSGKACRDMLFRTMAIEEPDIRVLNWAPGPLDTDMQVLARSQTGDTDLKVMFEDMHNTGNLLPCEVSVKKLVELLQENTWDTGSHIDFYDI
ncbi:DgyrCDS2336 [Dimorphilus gyrociliatus]|uniref:Sepiapterin reductase n=1 Tax=Dimorphilus gyrociliatus TaxID=2664684 RepID=A0A7I8VCS0_9ANNE|nr:DgyrCDS2336 [Dimorphilus gyrociliatus]